MWLAVTSEGATRGCFLSGNGEAATRLKQERERENNCGSLRTIRKMCAKDFGNGLNPGQRVAVRSVFFLNLLLFSSTFSGFPPPSDPSTLAAGLLIVHVLRWAVPVAVMMLSPLARSSSEHSGRFTLVGSRPFVLLSSTSYHFLIVSILRPFLERPYYPRLSEDLPAVRRFGGRPYP